MPVSNRTRRSVSVQTRRARPQSPSPSPSQSPSPSPNTLTNTAPLTSYPRYNFESPTRWTPTKCRKFLRLGTFVSQSTDFKPDGKWYSVYASWNAWGELSLGRFVHRMTFAPNVHVTLSPSTKRVPSRSSILVLRTLSDVQKFNDLYGTMLNRRWATIRWEEVARDYGGIEFRHYKSIAKYLRKNEANRYLWYLSLDCSCGCVWDAGLVKSIEFVGVKREA